MPSVSRTVMMSHARRRTGLCQHSTMPSISRTMAISHARRRTGLCQHSTMPFISRTMAMSHAKYARVATADTVTSPHSLYYVTFLFSITVL